MEKTLKEIVELKQIAKELIIKLNELELSIKQEVLIPKDVKKDREFIMDIINSYLYVWLDKEKQTELFNKLKPINSTKLTLYKLVKKHNYSVEYGSDDEKSDWKMIKITN